MTVKGDRPYAFAVIDEAQDLGVAEARFFAAMGAGRNDGLFFAGDLGQRIFQQPFSWKALGLDVRGRSHTLRINYRTSHQIRLHADRLLPATVSDVDGNAEGRLGTVSMFDESPPMVVACTDAEHECRIVGNWIKDRLLEGCAPSEVGVFVRSDAELKRARSAVKAAGALALLILRSLDRLEAEIIAWNLDGTGSDEAVRAELMRVLEHDADQGAGEEDEDDEEGISEALDLALTDQLYGGLGAFLLALQTGEADLLEVARAEIEDGLAAAAELNLVPQWWCFRLTLHLLDDLWGSSFHEVLPANPPEGDGAAWQQLRRLFIATLFGRKRSEIELWPSQIDAARRSVDSTDNLVVSLPTSAGKTRVAELCILKCLSEGRRIVFVTPLRALSAQTETGLQRTFGPLEKTISALYGSIGTSGFEQDALKTRHIVVATPEKLDFALRNDPTILDDVGLVVLDEGHMIGLGEREVRYEVQIQRLLRRADAAQRRLVCLSAIMPEGDQFDDFVSWIRRDEEGDAVSVDWRPTRIRFGEVLWRNNRARLELRVGATGASGVRLKMRMVPETGAISFDVPGNAVRFGVIAAVFRTEGGCAQLVRAGSAELRWGPSFNRMVILVFDFLGRSAM